MNKLYRVLLTLILLALVVAPSGAAFADGKGPDTAPGQAKKEEGEAPIFGLDSPNAIKDRYIVVFNERGNGNGQDNNAAKFAAADEVRGKGGNVHFVYESALNGFVATMPEHALKGLQHNPNVAYIEADQYVQMSDVNLAAQGSAVWGLDRIDQRALPLNTTYNYDYNGTGVNAYIIDTGIRRTHTEFGGRALVGYDAIGDGQNTNDCNGHGTHVAGTVGGNTYGVAKNVTLYAVRVLDCNGSGTNSGVIAGVDWVRTNHIKPAVANMSLGGGASAALDTAVSNAIAAGVVFGIAAGNDGLNACNYSPARVANAVTVGATTNTDARASYSNYGTCLDIFAPGSSITSAWLTNDTATNTINGTSMATPHVVGVLALYMQANPNASPATAASALVSNATSNVVTSAGTGSPNKLLYTVLNGGAPTPTPTPAPSPTPAPGGNNVVVNPGFESGTTGWTQYSSGGYTVIATTRPHAGSYSAYECDYSNCNEYVQQTLTVPSNGTLTYWWYMTSSEGTSTAYDYLYVRVYNTSGTLLATLRTWSNKNTRNTWQQDTLSLSAYAGQTVNLRFMSTTDSSINSAFFVDDVSVK